MNDILKHDYTPADAFDASGMSLVTSSNFLKYNNSSAVAGFNKVLLNSGLMREFIKR